MTHEIAALVSNGHVTAIDASDNMIQSALQYQSRDNISYQHCAVEHIHFMNQFDWITSFFCLQWLPDKRNAFKHIANSLKPNGKLAMIAPRSNPKLLAARNAAMSDCKWSIYFENYHDPLQYVVDDAYHEYARYAGFQYIEYKVEAMPVVFADYTQFFAFMLEMTAHKERIQTEEMKHEFVHDLLRRYLVLCPPNDVGQCELVFDIVKLTAQLA